METKTMVTGGGVKDILFGFGAGVLAAVGVKLIKIGVQKGYAAAKEKIEEKKVSKKENSKKAKA